ncbi:MAG: CPBP family intramembrane metalloprotease [Muribaculaceae bacterium]|jgi:membrane protease YdiL (CAAX protease family)|nr:CPBP family intramembrane metalloprotease [Muribaculaceae bacterium]
MAAPLPDIRPDSLLLTRRSRITLFCCTAVLGYLLTGLLTTLLIYKFGTANARVLRIAAIAQDILALIAPALVTAMMVTRLPAQLLELRGGVPGRLWMAALPVMIIAAPAMNCVIEFNQNIEATGALSAIVEKMRAMEENASAMIECMQGNGTWPDLLMNILIIGIAAGVSEELFFRGALQRLLSTGGVNVHAAIWISAIVFSAVHMQFFGFIPRTLLGAYFGYLLVWGRSIWLPAAAHALNNTIYVIAQWYYTRTGTPDVTVDNVGLGDTWPAAIASAIATALFIATAYRMRRR